MSTEPASAGGHGAPARRPTASVVLLAWNAWEHTRACLSSLEPTLAAGDEIVVVDNGSTDGTAAGLASFRVDHLVANEENRGFAVGANQGAGVAGGDVLVFLNNDTVVTPGWLELLLGPFADPAVVGTGPRTNFAAGAQLVQPVPYREPEGPLFEEFVARWNSSYAGRVREAAVLIGFCLAARRSAFLGVGGFDESFGLGNFEDNDLCIRLRAGGGRLFLADAAFVHHSGHATFLANSVDYSELMQSNAARFSAKWAAPATTGAAP